MDLQIPFIFVSLFSLASVLLIFIYKFGIKEKSYEEALAEQRQQTHILLGIKPKLKEKKSKKPLKKLQFVVKGKTATAPETDIVKKPEQLKLNPKNEDGQKKLHVEFIDDMDDVSAKTLYKKQARKDKVRPILIHKEEVENEPESLVNSNNLSYSGNHFEELHPKDDFELFRSVSGEEAPKDDSNKTISSGDIVTENQVYKKQSETDLIVTEVNNTSSLSAPSLNGLVSNSGKEKRKKKNEFHNLQLAGDTTGSNMPVLLNVVRKSELSRSEVQILIDLLLNKQHEAPAIVDEWCEGKSDPVQKLKKQLAEKEKMLLEEQQTIAGAQAKLREVRFEHQNEKTILLQKIRNMEDVMHAKQLEANRNHQQIQQLQNQVQEEVVQYHKLRDEHAALQIQRQQFEIRISQAQDSEVIINQLQSEIQELPSINNQLRMELTRFQEETIIEKERNQSLVVQLNNFQKELEQKAERNRQLEETRLQLELEIETILKQEKDLKLDASHLNSIIQQQNEEIRRFEHTINQYHQELQKHKDESSKLINQLTGDLRQAQEENMQMQVTHMNGSLQENKQHEVEILNLHNELASVKNQLNQQNAQKLKVTNALAEELGVEIEELKAKCNEGKLKLEEQKVKNNELREKNWKVMEALNAAECRIKNQAIFESTPDVEIQQEFIQRLFPEIKDEKITNSALFKVEGENFIRKYIENLQKPRNKESNQDAHQLQIQLQHYKNVIDNTEKMLNKLQKHIEQEEIKWRMQLADKTDELEATKRSYKEEFQEQLQLLEVELKKERQDKEKIIALIHGCKTDGSARSSLNSQ